ncbi:dihydroorotase multifunctional complex type [Prevotella sp. CAG:617]|nr:dihydroorotase multifunctional complex type [Prevotella sp. CAG:617]
MHRRICIKNATIVGEGHRFVGSLVTEDHRIAEIVEGQDVEPSVPADEIINAEGCYLLPGVIDTHVHFREPGLTHKADIESESRAAAAGGVTTFLDMPNNTPQTTTIEALRDKLELAYHKSHVNFGFYIGATNSNLSEIMHINPRKVCGIKLFMGASTGNMLVDNPDSLRDIFECAKMPIVAHCEDTAAICKNMERIKEQYGEDPDVALHAVIRNEDVCYKSSSTAAKLAAETGARLHIAHISTAKELQLIKPSRPSITAEACVPHLLFCDEDYARLGSRIKCNPAIKSRKDREALRKALTSGKIFTVGTDHAPHLLREKAGGCIKAVSGMPMIQFSLISMLELTEQNILSIEQVVELMCHNPARLFDIENRGFLREGYVADLTLVRPKAYWTLTPNRIESKCGWSPLEGHTFHWQVEKTFCNGFMIYNQGHITNTDFHGQAVTYIR